MHGIGNVINRIDHAQSGAIMAFRILDKLGMPVEDIAKVISGIPERKSLASAGRMWIRAGRSGRFPAIARDFGIPLRRPASDATLLP